MTVRINQLTSQIQWVLFITPGQNVLKVHWMIALSLTHGGMTPRVWRHVEHPVCAQWKPFRSFGYLLLWLTDCSSLCHAANSKGAFQYVFLHPVLCRLSDRKRRGLRRHGVWHDGFNGSCEWLHCGSDCCAWLSGLFTSSFFTLPTYIVSWYSIFF